VTSLPVESAARLVDRLDRALAPLGADRAALATDGDGTLWTGDVGEALFDRILEVGWIGEPARAALEAELAHVRNPARHGGSPAELARGLFTAYLRGAYAEDRMCATMAWCMAGRREADVRALSRELLEGSFGLRERLIVEACGLVQWACTRGVAVWLVSASPRPIVEEAAAIVAEELDVPVPGVLSMIPRVREGVIEPALDATPTYGDGKWLALGAVLDAEGRTLIGALGDNAFDASMLRAASVRVAIRPKPALLAIAAQVPGLVRADTPEL
jgi:phosphoserine phosphatase